MSDYLIERKAKVEALRKLGIDPYGGREEGVQSVADVLAAFEEGRAAKVAGRLVAWRSHGKTTFADVLDSSGRLQIYVKKDDLASEESKLLPDYLDLGDIISAEGELFKTKTGMPTLKVRNLRILSKSLLPLPEKWHGLKDVETRYRQRYLDLISNEESRNIFKARSRAVAATRRLLDGKGYLEVETPMMHSIPGGAAGRPFTTHHHALGTDLYLRIAPELYLKRLLVGGFERVYELNRSFRNEGISTRHNPEFTMLEVYTAFADAEDVMRLTEDILKAAVTEIAGKLTVEWRGMEIDFSVFERVSFAQLLWDAFAIRPEDPLERWAEKLRDKGVSVSGENLSRTKLLKIVGELIEPGKRRHPVFVTDYFTELCPLARPRRDNPAVSERFELYIGGMEVANGYSELNDPQEQLRRFRDDLDEGDTVSTAGMIDMDFVRALEHGMPPAGGLGIGMDRLVMVLTGQESIREVILFPQLKPEVRVE